MQVMGKFEQPQVAKRRQRVVQCEFASRGAKLGASPHSERQNVAKSESVSPGSEAYRRRSPRSRRQHVGQGESATLLWKGDHEQASIARCAGSRCRSAQS